MRFGIANSWQHQLVIMAADQNLLSVQSIVMAAAPLARHLSPNAQERLNTLVADPDLFNETLRIFHAKNGTRFTVPVVGRKDLNLHRLFLEITTRGGIEKVTKERRLKEVSRVLNFPATATNVSFVIRKYYYMLLYRFEQIYYFGADEANAAAAPVEEAPSASNAPAIEFTEASNSAPVEAGSSHRRGKSPVRAIIEAPQSMKGAPVVGVVDSEFSEGYCVTVAIGADTLKGVIMKKLGQPEHSGAIVVTTGDSETMDTRSHQRPDKAPKVRKVNPPVTRFKEGYNLYSKEQEAKLNPLKLLKSKELRKLIDDRWNNLPEDDKAVYQENGLKYEERCRLELKENRERMKSRMTDILSEIVPSPLVPALPAPAMEPERRESHRGLDVNRSPSRDASQEDKQDN
ncbi:hypothetical protein Syun_030468 [Stephania yunnanensis]|uniref:HMG box domain-containing protein n=1 Tax=Stephania yunnanensis TaxID=152371 RepID=A0AAP0EFV0_9MAGN